MGSGIYALKIRTLEHVVKKFKPPKKIQDFTLTQLV